MRTVTVAPTISAEARGRLRLLVTQLENDARRIERAADALPRRMLRDLALKSEIGRARTLARILAMMPVPPFHSDGRRLAWRYLKPTARVPAAAGAPDQAADEQACVTMYAVLVNSGGRPRVSVEPFGAAFTRHCLGRLLDRSGMRADPVDAMFAAHDELARLGAEQGAETFGQADFLVPAAGGAFSATPRRVGARQSPLAVCRTWFDADMVHADQAVRLAAWREITDQAAA